MADYVATDTETGKRFLVRRADSNNHARQLLAENVQRPGSYDYQALAAGSVAEIPEYVPPAPAPAPPAPEEPPLAPAG